MTARFRHFAAIDWSGAAGERHKGIAVALCTEGNGAPVLVRPGHRWSREEVLGWLLEEMPSETLVGMDLGISLAFPFFPGWVDSPGGARSLWALVDRLCADDPHLAITSFVDHAEIARHFRRHGGREGDLFGGGRGRFRETERAQAQQGCKPYSNFNLVGAAQVGKSSLSGMRMLHRLQRRIPVWPIDPLPAPNEGGGGSVIVEIYTTIAAIEAGRTAARSKMRTVEELNAALAKLGSEEVPDAGAIDDHSSDALVTAAWLRRAAHRPTLWHPIGLTPEIARTEGWTFGAA